MVHPPGSVERVMVAPDGSWLASNDNELRIWDQPPARYGTPLPATLTRCGRWLWLRTVPG
jgi:hypothetical protein